MTRQLEIGPGDCPLLGDWDRLDAWKIPSVPLTYIVEWGAQGLPIPDDSYDLVYSSHAIEHVPWYLVKYALKEVYRILKPGGSFEVWTVDFAVVVDHYLERQIIGDWDCGGRVYDFMDSVAGRIFAYEKEGNKHMWHKSLFDREKLAKCLAQAGFERIAKLEETRGHDHGEINMGVVGYKPR